MRWIGMLFVLIGAGMLGANTFGVSPELAPGSPVVGGIVMVTGLLLLAGGGRRD